MTEISQAHSHNSTVLNDRTLFYDGDSVLSSEEIIGLVSSGTPSQGLCVDRMNDEIRQYNTFVPTDQQIKTKDHIRDLNFDWDLPEEYLTLDPIRYVVEKFNSERDKFSAEELRSRRNRIITELSLYEQLQLIPILRALIFVINTLADKKQVWGVGRGSSVSSYVLYVIGAHDIDSYKYGLDVTDFLRLPTDT